MVCGVCDPHEGRLIVRVDARKLVGGIDRIHLREKESGEGTVVLAVVKKDEKEAKQEDQEEEEEQ